MKIYHLDPQSNYREGIKSILEIHFNELEVKSSDFTSFEEEDISSEDLLIIEPFGNTERTQLIISRHLGRQGKVFILSSEFEKVKILDYLKLDVVGFATKDIPTLDLVRAIHNIYNGERYYISSVASILHQEYVTNH